MVRVPLLLLAIAGCARKVADSPDEAGRSALDEQQARAAIEGPEQTLEICRVASIALAEGQIDVAEAALRQAVGKMQDFHADGQFRALVGSESSKEWKGDPFEKMMAFLYLGLLLEDRGNTLAMTKSAILADTGTSKFQYRADFVPAFVLQAMVYDSLGEEGNADRSLQQAVDAMYLRELTAHLSALLSEVAVDGDPQAIAAARVLLLAGLPAGLSAHPRDVALAIDGALSRATDMRQIVLEGSKDDRPDELASLTKADVRRSFEFLEPLTRSWREAALAHPIDVEGRLAADAAALAHVVKDDPRLVLWIESGRGPQKVANGRYGEILRFVQVADPTVPPSVALDGREIRSTYLDSLTYQASTRGSRWVDGFLEGKAVFKDAAPFLGWTLLAAGDIASSARGEAAGEVAAVLYILGAVTWVAGAVTNPAADTRAWELLPESLWIVAADPSPGRHHLVVDGREYTVDIPDEGTVVHLIPALPPGGTPTFGTPCSRCDEGDDEGEGEGPLAVPISNGETP